MKAALTSGNAPRDLLEGGPIVLRPALQRRRREPIDRALAEAVGALERLAREVEQNWSLARIDREYMPRLLRSRAKALADTTTRQATIAECEEVAKLWASDPEHPIAQVYRRAAEAVAPLKVRP